MNIAHTKGLASMLAIATASMAIAACGSSSSNGSSSGAGANSASSEAQNAAAGDIPDNQQFLRFKDASGGYSLLYPQGWARKGSSADITFADKDNTVHVVISHGGTPTVSSVSAELAKEATSDPTLKPGKPQAVKLPSGPAVHVVYHVQGPADPVTGKRPTLMVDRYALASKGRVATVDEGTPVGVDNVDAYRMIIRSFKWS